MKLAFCLFNYFPYGGLQRDFLRIARVCRQRGHDIHVYTMRWEGEPEPGLNLHLIQASGLQNHSRIRSFSDQIQSCLAAEQFDLVLGFNKMPGLDLYYAADVCYQARVREQRPAFYRWLPRYRQLAAFEQAVFARGGKTAIMLIAPRQQAEFMHYYQTETERFHILPPGIAQDRKAPVNAAQRRADIRASLGLAADEKLLLMVGSGFRTKGLDRSIAALASLPDDLRARCRLWVIGQDDPLPFLKLARRAGVAQHLRFLGGRPDVPDFLLAADLLLQPSYHENTGTALLEAMIAGLPVLTVDVCGYAHYVSEAGCGTVLSSPFSQTAMNQQLAMMLLSPESGQWRQNGLAFGEHADIYHMPDKAADLIERIKK